MAILAEAFMTDPVISWVFPDADDRRIAQEVLYQPMAHQAARAGLVQSSETAAAIWIDYEPNEPPDLEPDPHPALNRNAERLTSLGEATGARHPTHVAHRYLAAIGVLPSHHGRGLGTALLHSGLMTDRPVYLEATTERSRQLYRRHGFVDFGDPIHIDDSPPLWPMWREGDNLNRSTP
ncbi:GNAT family N-acetyltransferase [Stackebrandtia endophytica]|uniref:GNAT family N-acetyltransferase n=1 Tax=Stackebrandtia endophytica TaxID=1496996 RepID=UPI0011516FB0|nr:GNAT family N-acetyltransferase [Stackebrandtia endophytica]